MTPKRVLVLTLALVLALSGATLVLQKRTAAPTRSSAEPSPVVASATPTSEAPSDPPSSTPTTSPTPKKAPEAAPRSRKVRLSERPNIVMIMADDMREDDLRFMPLTRKLIGDRGVRFQNAFSPYPLCCPARSSFLTGKYTHNHNVWSHLEPWGFRSLDDSSTLPLWLQKGGYNTVFLGKYLNYYGVQSLPDDGPSTHYVPPGWTDWRGAIDGGLPFGHPLFGGTYHYFDTTLNVNGTLEGHEGEYQTTVFGDQSVEIIERYAAARKPFFLWASYLAPHHGLPVEPDDPGEILRDDGEVTLLDSPARPDYIKGRFDSEIRKAPGLPGEKDVSDKPFFIRAMPEVNKAEAKGMLEVTRQRAEALAVLDAQVARTVRALRRAGELRNTIIAFTSDNGYYLGEHRRREGKTIPYEPALNVPLVVRGPGVPPGEQRNDPFLMIDFAPTFLAAAGLPTARRGIDGVDLWHVARGGDQGWDRAVLTDSGPRAKHKRYSVGLRTEQHYYVEHRNGKRELYDMVKDPDQLSNVANRRRSRPKVRELSGVLADLRKCQGSTCSEQARPVG